MFYRIITEMTFHRIAKAMLPILRILPILLIAFTATHCGKDPAAQDTDTANPDGSYEDGVYHCCAEGDGTDCCAGYDQGMCFQYGGVYEQCIGEGETIGGKIICALCCDGLTQVWDAHVTTDTDPAYPDGCVEEGPPDLLICVPCGNGICDASENRCNCPDDCGDGPSDTSSDDTDT